MLSNKSYKASVSPRGQISLFKRHAEWFSWHSALQRGAVQLISFQKVLIIICSHRGLHRQPSSGCCIAEMTELLKEQTREFQVQNSLESNYKK